MESNDLPPSVAARKGRTVGDDEAEVSSRIGLVVFRFNQIEGHSHRFAWHCWDWSERIGLVMTGGAQIDHVWDMIDEGIWSQAHRHPYHDRFKAWRKRAEALRSERNDVAHSEWWYHGSSFDIAPMDKISRKAKRAGGSRWPVFKDWRADLDRIAKETGEAVSELLEIMFGVVTADQES